MLSKYDDFNEIKKDIENFLCMLQSHKKLPCNNEIKCIIKYILFLKKYIENDHIRYYKDYMIYDSLMLIQALTQNSKRIFFNIYRSFIENFVRSVLELEDYDRTGVRKLFEKFKELGENKTTKDIIYFIEGQYSEGCDFVHSNIRAGINIFTYYSDIVLSDEMNDEQIRNLIMKVLTLLKKMITLIIYTNSSKVGCIFYRNKQKLKFLIGEKNFNIFEKQLSIAC